MNFYRICGFGVASDIALADATPAPTGPADVTICLGDVPASLPDARETEATFQVGPGRMLFAVPGIARFLIEAGREIVVAPAADLGDVAAFVTGNVFGMLLQQRGLFVMRGAAVEVNDRAVLLCGASGVGKSTLLALLAKRGNTILCDELGIVDTGEGRPVVRPDGLTPKLWENSIAHLALQDSKGSAVRPNLKKYLVPFPAGDRTLPLGALYNLQTTHLQSDHGIDGINIVDSANLIRMNIFKPRLIEAFAAVPSLFQGTAAIAANARVFVCRYSYSPASLAGTADALEAHWRKIGLTERAA